MKLNARISKPGGPLVLLAIAVGVIPLIITLAVAPGGAVWQAASGLPAVPGTGATPPAPPVPRKQLVPVRSSAPPQSPGKPGDRVALRQLIIATDARDFGLPAWRQILD